MADEEKKVNETATTHVEPESHRLPKKRGNKFGILAAVVAVIAIAGIGFWQWHETPGFCAAFCHNMDEYLYTYNEPQGVGGVDKYGNVVSNTNAMMATLHRQNNTTAMSEITCMGCHHAIIGEQISEGIGWVLGSYKYPLDERVGDQLTHWWGEPGNVFCSNENCHAYLLGNDNQISMAKLQDSTRWMSFNPHEMHHESLNLACTDCHKGHRASVYVCAGCHEEAELPSGWITYQQSQELMAQEFNGNAQGFVNKVV